MRRTHQARSLLVMGLLLSLPLIGLAGVLVSRSDARREELLAAAFAEAEIRETAPARPELPAVPTPAEGASVNVSGLEEDLKTLLTEAALLFDKWHKLRGETLEGSVFLGDTEAWYLRLENILQHYPADWFALNDCAWLEELEDVGRASILLAWRIEELEDNGQMEPAMLVYMTKARLMMLRRSCPMSIFMTSEIAEEQERRMHSPGFTAEQLRELAEVIGADSWTLKQEMSAYKDMSAEEWHTYMQESLPESLEKRGFVRGVQAWVERLPPFRHRLNAQIEKSLSTAKITTELIERPYWEVEEQLVELHQDYYWTFIATEAVLRQAVLELSRLALLLELHKINKGVYPSTLSELTESTQDLRLTDPFTGNSYAYESDGKCYILRSQGPKVPRKPWMLEQKLEWRSEEYASTRGEG